MIEQVRTERPQTEEGRTNSAAGFKPLALPALAAAVRATRSQPRRAKVHDLPPILRKESFGE